MRTISRVSAVFLLLESKGKEPVTGASILVDGKKRRYMTKADGHCVFTDLPPVPHTYEISAPGFRPVRRTLPAKPEFLPEVVSLQYDEDSPKLPQLPHFRLRFVREGKALAGETVQVELSTPSAALRVTEDAPKGGYHLSLSGSFSTVMLYQQYTWGKGGGRLLTVDYDRGSGAYQLQQPLPEAMGEGSALRPVWQLVTNRDGVAVLPVIGLFMQREQLEFSFAAGGKTVQQTLVVPQKRLDAEIAL